MANDGARAIVLAAGLALATICHAPFCHAQGVPMNQKRTYSPHVSDEDARLLYERAAVALKESRPRTPLFRILDEKENWAVEIYSPDRRDNKGGKVILRKENWQVVDVFHYQ